MKIIMDEECTVEKAEEIRQLLLGALSGSDVTEISFSKVENVDLSFFQLLHAALLSFSRKGRELVLKNDLHPRCATKAAMTGWQRIVADKQD